MKNNKLIFLSILNGIKDYCVGPSQITKNINIGLPRFPSITIVLLLCFMSITIPYVLNVSKALNIIPIIIIFLLDYRWWTTYLFKSSLINYPLKWLFVLLFIGIALSTYSSLNIQLSLYELIKALTIIWIAIGAYEIISQVDYRRWLPWFINIFTVAGLIAILNLIAYHNSDDFREFIHNIFTILHLSWASVCFLPIFIYCFKADVKRIQIVFIIFCAIIISIFFENRSTIIGFSSVAIVYLAIYYNKLGWKIYPVISIILVLTFTIVIYLYNTKFTAFVNGPGEIFAPTWIIDPHRQAIWQFSWNAIPELPFFGFGIRALNMIDGAMADIPWLVGTHERYDVAYFLHTSPHNILFQWLLELGWINFILILLIYGLLAIKLLFEKNKIRKLELLFHAGYFAIAFINASIWDTFWFIDYCFPIAMIRGLANSVAIYGDKFKEN